MSEPSQNDREQNEARYRAAQKLDNDSMHLQLLGVSAFGIAAAIQKIDALKKELLPPRKSTWLKWGNDAWSRSAAYVMMALGVASFAFGMVLNIKAKAQTKLPMGKPVDADAAPLPEIPAIQTSPAVSYVNRYQKEVSASEKTL